MIKVEHIETFNWEGAIRGLRNPLNSWDKSDSYMCYAKHCNGCKHRTENCWKTPDGIVIGENDLSLMQRLYKAGNEHRKYLRQIFVSMDITSHHIFWGEFDTYKIGVTRNSCSKMHKIHVKEFLPEDFSHEGIDEVGGCTKDVFHDVIDELERLRIFFNQTKEKKYWRAMIELLPQGYNLKATVSMNYENVMNIINQRSNHKLFEWREFCDILLDLPYVKEIRGE